jgi:DNA-binding response OmpR family regulator
MGMPPLDLISPDAALCHVLREQTEVTEFTSLAEALDAWQNHLPQIVLLDTDALRNGTKKLSETLVNTPDPVSLLILGDPGKALGDDLIAETFPKPARLGNILARLQFYAQRVSQKHDLSLTLGPWLFAPRQRRLTSANKTVKLTDKESSLLEVLCATKETVPREELLATIWGYDSAIDTHTLETHIYRLRRKIQPALNDPKEGDIFHADRGGYRLNPSWLRS